MAFKQNALIKIALSRDKVPILVRIWAFEFRENATVPNVTLGQRYLTFCALQKCYDTLMWHFKRSAHWLQGGNKWAGIQVGTGIY